MPQEIEPTEPDTDPVTELRARAADLERQLAETEKAAHSRIINAELKVEAVRAGMIDLDGLKLIDHRRLEIGLEGEVTNASEIMGQLRRAKPWLFGGSSSSSSASPPPAQSPRVKLATEMTDEEYRAARAALLKQQL